MKWKMINARKFTATHSGYFIVVEPFGSIYPYWEIWENGKVIDHAAKHSPVTTDFNKELACKVQAERRLTELIALP